MEFFVSFNPDQLGVSVHADSPGEAVSAFLSRGKKPSAPVATVRWNVQRNETGKGWWMASMAEVHVSGGEASAEKASKGERAAAPSGAASKAESKAAPAEVPAEAPKAAPSQPSQEPGSTKQASLAPSDEEAATSKPSSSTTAKADKSKPGKSSSSSDGSKKSKKSASSEGSNDKKSPAPTPPAKSKAASASAKPAAGA